MAFDVRVTPPRPSRSLLLAAAIVLLALNLRVLVSSVGVLIGPLREDLGLDPTTAGALTTLPVLCFAVFGATGAKVARGVGLDRTALAVLIVSAAGLVARAFVDSGPAFFALSTLSLAACAVGNVILPALAKQHFPDRVPLLSALYGAALLAGGALGSFVTVPIAETFGDWRVGIGAWSVLALAAAVPWIPAALARRTDRWDTVAGASGSHRLGRMVRSPLAWACTLCFAAQSAQAYAQFGWFPAVLEDAGLAPASAGAMLGILGAVGIPTTLLLPPLIARFQHTGVLPWSFALITAAGWAGVLWAPTAAPWLWATLLGIGGCAFTWVLTMIGRSAATPAGTAALSGFAQPVGYLLAGIGPFGTGLLRDLTGGWTVPVIVLLVAALLIGPTGAYLDRDRVIEDDLG